MKINIIGIFPPPLGGISSHILRLAQTLTQNGFNATVFDDRCYPFNSVRAKIVELKKNRRLRIQNYSCDPKESHGVDLKTFNGFGRLYFYFLFKKIRSREIIHYHHTEFELYGALISTISLFRKGFKSIITYHSFRDNHVKKNSMKYLYLIVNKFFVSHFIVVNKEIKEKLILLGINATKISVIPAFLPPVDKKEDYELIPPEIWKFLEIHSPVVSANGSRILFYEGSDLYGLDMCVDACHRLMKNYPNIGFLFCFPGVSEKHEYIVNMRAKIKSLDLSDNFMLITNVYQFYPLLLKSNIFVRPTNSDGDAISIREALYFKIPVVASDVVHRPAGTTLFRNRDMDDFYNNLSKILSDTKAYADELEKLDSNNHLDNIINLYKTG